MSKNNEFDKIQSQSLQNLLNKIKMESKKEVNKIKRDTKKKLEEIETETEQLVKKIQKQELDKEVGRLEFIRKRTETEFQQQARRIEIQAKEKLIDDVFEEVEKEFNNFREHKKYKKYLEKTLRTTAKNMGITKMKILADKRDTVILKEIVAKISEKDEMQFIIESSKIETSGGFILTDIEERVRIDHTIENMLQTSREEIRTKINELLFE